MLLLLKALNLLNMFRPLGAHMDIETLCTRVYHMLKNKRKRDSKAITVEKEKSEQDDTILYIYHSYSHNLYAM